MKISALFLTIILLISSCATTQTPKYPEPLDRFYGETWELHGFQVTQDDVDITTQVDTNERYTIIFRNDGTVVGKAHCNSYFGKFAADSNRISIFETGATKMFCGDNSRDTDFFRGLERATTFELYRSEAVTPGKYRLILHSPEKRALVFLKDTL